MSPEQKTCQNCKNQFTIDPDDFGFYAKISVPPPTWCPECRKQRRLAWRNDTSLYSRTCGLCNKSVVSIYAPNGPMQVYCQKCWWSDAWDAKDYGREYDFSRPFFEQFFELQRSVPILTTVNDNGIASVNCEYTHDFSFSKNCYMVLIAWKIEDCLYSVYLVNGKEIVDGMNSMGECEYTYETVFTEKCYRCRYAYYSSSLSDCAFMYDCRDCSDCFMCVGLRHKRYCFKNQQYTKEEYEKILAAYRLDTASGTEKARQEFFGEMYYKSPRRFANLKNCVSCAGDGLINGKNADDCFNVLRPEDCKWIENSDTPKDSYDISVGGELNQCYEGVTPDNSYRGRFAIFSWKNTDVWYVDGCHSSKYLFGCAGIKNGQYCILNRQYTKEEYEALVPKIIEHMDAMPYVDALGREYRHGEFFPPERSYFAYNESVAQDYFPLSRQEAEEAHARWQDEFQMTIGKETIRTGEIPDAIDDVPKSIVNEVLACEKCARNYRIVPAELAFYQRMKIPIPRRCFYCRNKDRFMLRNPFALWERQCDCAGVGDKKGMYSNSASHEHGTDPCRVVFSTPFSPERQEVVYCERCYQSEIV